MPRTQAPLDAPREAFWHQKWPCVLGIGANDEDRGRHLVLGWLLVSSSCAPALLLVCAQFRASLPRYLLTFMFPNVLGWRCTKGSAEARWTSLKSYQASLFVRFAPSVVGHLLTYLLTYLRAKGKPTTVLLLASSCAWCVSVCSSLVLCVSLSSLFSCLVVWLSSSFALCVSLSSSLPFLLRLSP